MALLTSGKESPRGAQHSKWCAAKVALVRTKGQNGAQQKLLWCAAEDKMVRSKVFLDQHH